MPLTLRRLEAAELEPWLPILLRWENDPEITGFQRPNTTAATPLPITADEIRTGHARPDKRQYLLLDGERPIGELSLDLRFPWLKGSDPEHTAWVAIVIGERDSRGRGLGAQAMQLLEAEAVRLGLRRLELGVFSHNERARRLYRRLGYEAFARIPHFTYDAGLWHDDIRMEKWLDGRGAGADASMADQVTPAETDDRTGEQGGAEQA